MSLTRTQLASTIVTFSALSAWVRVKAGPKRGYAVGVPSRPVPQTLRNTRKGPGHSFVPVGTRPLRNRSASSFTTAPAETSNSSNSSSSIGNSGSADMAGSKQREMLKVEPYLPPDWALSLSPIPRERLCMAQLPTPIHRWHIPGLPEGTQLYIKRDDLSGMELSGNKVRKLEFLLPQALEGKCDCVVTIGGIQSNHARATAVAARYAGLDAHLVLRTSAALVDTDPGLVGNLLVERLCGAHIQLVTKEEYAKFGSPELGSIAVRQLEQEGKRPYLIPVGGSNALGTWGYIEAVGEIERQLQGGAAGGAHAFDSIVMACGSGGTAAGLALGVHLSSLDAKVHAYGVCDSPRYFYDYIQGLLNDLGASHLNSEDLLEVEDAKGQGYAVSTEAELRLVRDVAVQTGVVLDPVYSGKALKGLLEAMSSRPEQWQHKSVLFIHTGGLLGMFDKLSQLQPLVGSCKRMDLQG